MLSFDVTKKCLVGEGWCPISATDQVKLFCIILLSMVHFFNYPCKFSETKDLIVTYELIIDLADKKCTAAGILGWQITSWCHISGAANQGITAYTFPHK